MSQVDSDISYTPEEISKYVQIKALTSQYDQISGEQHITTVPIK